MYHGQTVLGKDEVGMSFSSLVKQQICQESLDQDSARAQLAGLFFSRASLTMSRGWGISYASENATITKHVYQIIKQYYHLEPQLRVIKKMRFYKANTYSVDLHSASEVVKDLGIISEAGIEACPTRMMNEQEKRAFLQGCFLASGSINDPSSANYHLELSCESKQLAEYIDDLMNEFYLPSKRIVRKQYHVVYLKAGDKIADFLRLVNATQALLDFENARIKRDFYNQITRLDNCEIANEMKTQKAAQAQLDAIQFLADKKVQLNEGLNQAAKLRQSYPEASLVELCEAYEQQYHQSISKSGMKHRLAKIKQMAKELGLLVLIFLLVSCAAPIQLKKQTFTIELGQDVFANPSLYAKSPVSNDAKIDPVTKGIKKVNNRFVNVGTDFLVVGVYDFELKDRGQSVPFSIKIKDTKPPTLSNAQSDIDVYRYTTIDWSKLLGASDLSGVTYQVDATIDTTTLGSQTVKIRVSDRFGNSVVREVTIHVV